MWYPASPFTRFPCTVTFSLFSSSPHVKYLVGLAYSFITDLITLGYYFGRADRSLLTSGKDNYVLLCLEYSLTVVALGSLLM